MNAHPDVLIVGGGLAALTAALAVREKGRTAAIVSLGPAGRSGNAVVAEGNFSGVSGEDGDTAAAFLRDLERSAQGLADPALLSCLANESGETLLRLERLGVVFQKRNGAFVHLATPGHAIPRTVPTRWEGFPFASKGMAFLKPLGRRIVETGVQVLNGWRVVRLLRRDGRVTGVVAHERKTGEIRVLHAGSVILACGGFGGLFRRNNNVADIHGDGVALALEAGCVLRDMEQIQFYPLMMFKPLKSIVPGPILKAGAVLRDRTGERFMDRYDPAGDAARRDAMARAVFMEVQAGRGIGDSIHVDCTGVSEEDLNGKFAAYAERLRQNGINIRTDWLLATPAAHYALGGVRIDASGRTGIPGLYAAGEVTGGVHGANRLPGCALMEAAVFGRRAGLAAAEESGPIETTAPDIALPTEAGPACAVAEDLRDLKALLWDNASLVRTAEGLGRALEGIRRLRGKWRGNRQPDGMAFAGNLLVAEAVVRSALVRTESRGAQYRSDYPDTDSAWARPVSCSLHGDALVVS